MCRDIDILLTFGGFYKYLLKQDPHGSARMGEKIEMIFFWANCNILL